MKKMFNCFFCNKDCSEEDPVEVRWSVPGFKMHVCAECTKRRLMDKKSGWYIYHDWVFWPQYARDDIRTCKSCGRFFIPSEKAIEFYKGSILYINATEIRASSLVSASACLIFDESGSSEPPGIL